MPIARIVQGGRASRMKRAATQLRPQAKPIITTRRRAPAAGSLPCRGLITPASRVCLTLGCSSTQAAAAKISAKPTMSGSGRALAEHDGRGGDADDRHQQRAERGGHRRQPADDRPPQEMREADADQCRRTEIANIVSLRTGQRCGDAFEHERAGGDEQQAEQQLPRRIGQRRDRDLGPFDVDGGDGPAQRAAERIEHEGRQAGVEQRRHQDHDAGDAQPEGEPAHGGELLAEHEAAEHRGPDRHRISDDDGARGGAAQLREAGENLKRRDVEETRRS